MATGDKDVRSYTFKLGMEPTRSEGRYPVNARNFTTTREVTQDAEGRFVVTYTTVEK